MNIPASLCIRCKGSRYLCGYKPCPLMPRIDLAPKIEKTLGKDFFGPSYSVFVGRSGYPDVNLGPLAAIENRTNIDNPASWFGMGYSRVIELRSLLLRSKQPVNVRSKGRFVEETQEIAMADGQTDVEMLFRSKPLYRVSFSDMVQPMGPVAGLERMKITENTRIPAFVERIVSDEMKAQQAGFELYRKGQDVYKITTILSSGVLGRQGRRKLVPTRWSITATDDIIFRHLASRIKDFPQVNEYLVYSAEYLSNHFEILVMPGSWEFENFEAWSPGSFWAHNLQSPEIVEEYEPYEGRASYAEGQGGGYYAARIGVAEGLNSLGRQGRVVSFREISEGYVIPLGVWVVRETVRNAFRGEPRRFATLQEALGHINSRLRIGMLEYVKQSKILGQRRMSDFFRG